ncbi:MAG TPA: hypothetical protein VJA94_23220 [Candidatus Angelobacter sp.]
MTSVCGFISKDGQPYSVYYALIHNTRRDIFVRLSLSAGEWWNHKSYRNRHAICIDVTPGGKAWRMSVRERIYSPQQNFDPFGRWLTAKTDQNDPLLQELLEVAAFIVNHDPAVLTYLSGHNPDYTGREVQRFVQN